MRKCYIITHHSSYNYGAYLQAFASYKYLSAFFETKIIDYIPDYLQGYGTSKNTFANESRQTGSFLKGAIFALIKTPSFKKQKAYFDALSKGTLSLTDECINTSDLEKLEKVDFYCTGSDQVWNNFYSHKFEDAYFLEFVHKNSHCFSLSSSLGRDAFNDEEKQYLKERLQKYELITTREIDGVNLLSSIGLQDVHLMLDPTLLISEIFWEKYADGAEIRDLEPYVLVYQLHGDSDAFAKAQEFAKKKKMRVIRIITMYHQIRISINCKNVILPKVEEFLSLIKNAEFFFTDSFHGTLFSILFETKSGITLPKKFSNRITNILNIANADKLIVHDVDNWASEIDRVDLKRNKGNLLSFRDIKVEEMNSYILNMIKRDYRNE